MTALGLYLHWPYCARICPYCDFNVYRARGTADEPLLQAILADMAAWRARTGPRPLTSLHFGGGTPSLMAPAAVALIIETADRLWGFERAPEIGLEANPNEAHAFADLAAAGVERLSLGVQALDDAALKRLGRDHDVAGALGAVESAKRAAPRVSLDLMYAREGQTPKAWAEELERALALGLDHLSAYTLTLEPGTAFAKQAARGALTLPGGEAAAAMMALTHEIAGEAGLAPYEISNFARGPAHRSRHNRLYWTGGDWIGVGPGAHARLGAHARGGRIAGEVARQPQAYIAAASGEGAQRLERLTALEEAQERVLMGLRIVEGIDRTALRAATGYDVDEVAAAPYVQADLLTLNRTRAALTPTGRFYGDRIAADLAPG